MDNYLDELSSFVSHVEFESLDSEAIAATEDVILDTIGAIVAGSQLPENIALAALVAKRSGPPTATLFGSPYKIDPMLAALVNATSGVALEMDEGNRFGGGHPSIHVLPGAIAVAEEIGANGQQLIESVLVGYEIESRMGAATKTRFNVHSHGHWGTIGTAVAVAKLNGYTAKQIRDVINIAGSMSPANSWTPAFEGATVRNLYPGRSGMQGILATHIFECGFTGLDDGPSDIFGTILGDKFDPNIAVAELGDEYRIQKNYFKFYACCRFNHPALDAALDIRSRYKFSPKEIDSVPIVAHAMLDGMLGGYPKNMLAAKFNVPYAVAAALVTGSLDVGAFYDNTRDNQQIREIASKVEVTVDPAIQQDGSQVRVTVNLKDGQSLESFTSIVRGDYGNRVPRAELLEKFHSLTDHILGAAKAGKIITTVESLDQLSDIRELTSLVSIPNANSPPRI